MPYIPKERTEAQRKEHDRYEAIRTLNVEAARAWMSEHGFGAQGDDHVVLISLHELRAVYLTMPGYLRRESVRWLRANHPDSIVLKPRPARVPHRKWTQMMMGEGSCEHP